MNKNVEAVEEMKEELKELQVQAQNTHITTNNIVFHPDTAHRYDDSNIGEDATVPESKAVLARNQSLNAENGDQNKQGKILTNILSLENHKRRRGSH